jgi:hypothetical protein
VLHFRRPVYSGLVLGFVAAPLGILWYQLGDAWLGILALVFAAVALALVPVDLRRNAFETGGGLHPDSFKGRWMAIGALLPLVMIAAFTLIYVLAE